MSEDEQVTRDILLSETGYLCVQVCDAKNLRRGLLLTAQLAEAEVPFTLALNMADEATSRGFVIDLSRLAGELGIEVVSTVAVERKGLSTLQAKLPAARPSRFSPHYDAAIEAAIAEVAPLAAPRRDRPARPRADGARGGRLAPHLARRHGSRRRRSPASTPSGGSSRRATRSPSASSSPASGSPRSTGSTTRS